MATESWREERDRLVRLLKAFENGEVSHIDEDGNRQLQAAGPEKVSLLRQRLSELNQRLG
jgi:hypothetical protein